MPENNRSSYQSAILILADGARYDVFENLLGQGRLPHIQKHIIARGSYARMTTVFTSTTGPAYIPFLTGCFPGTANIPGIRWFDKKAYATKSFLNPHRFRSYCGWEAFFMNRDLRADLPTLFELTENPINVFSPIARGVSKKNDKRPWLKAYLMTRAHMTGNYEPVDEQALNLFLKHLEEPSEFRFMVLTGIDGFSHNTHPVHAHAIEAYHSMDEAVRKIAEQLQSHNRYDTTLIGLCSDHGLTQTHTHFDVSAFMERELGMPTLHYPNVFRKSPEASAQISGNGMAHLYLKNGGWLNPCYYEEIIQKNNNLVDIFLNHDAVDLIMTRTHGGEIRVDSTRGTALVKEENGTLQYELVTGDPFGFSSLTGRMTFEESLERTFDTDYPDVLLQIAQIFRSPRCGDILLSAKVGYDLRLKWEVPEHKSSHGSLRREHMMTPFCLSHPIEKKFLRTADVFPSLLKALGKNIPGGIDGTSFI